jgi:cellulose synthase (UDP-forming)
MRSFVSVGSKPVRLEPLPHLVDVMSRRQKYQFLCLACFWAATIIIFWLWWFDELHVVSNSRFLVNSIILAWATVLPGYYFFFVFQMKKPNPSLSIPNDLRVAMVVTKTSTEPLSLVIETLQAALAQTYVHDTWLADEEPDSETLEWCRNHRVSISTRRGVAEYHRPVWPRRTKCKEGNLAYFYDTYAYDRYDIVAQLDADHRPGRGYLEEMLRPFADPKVGYVSAPSICDANAKRSWAARGRLYAEGSLHGSLQAGYSNGWAPLCIGSHYAVRMAALKEIGGLGPELAEDHSTTLMMNAYGWKGVHAFDAEAHGDGPLTFSDCMTQEFQWSRSLTTILASVTPTYWRRLPAKLKLQFIFAQLWYPCLGLTMLLAYSLPIVALATDTPWVSVSYVDFVFHKILWTFAALLTVTWVKRNGWLRPKDSKIFAWETILFQLARWPWVLFGFLAAVIDLISRRQTEFKITPKGVEAGHELPFRFLLPYLFIAFVSGAMVLLTDHPIRTSGYYYLATLCSLLYSALLFVMVWKHWREASGPLDNDRSGARRRQDLIAASRSEVVRKTMQPALTTSHSQRLEEVD